MKKKKSYVVWIFVLIFCCLSTAVFSQSEYYQDIEGNKTLEEVVGEKFTSIDVKINQGLNNGVYWLKFQNSTPLGRIVELQSAKLFEFKTYNGAKQIEKTVLPTFKIPAKKTAYIRIHAKKEAFIPIDSFVEDDFQVHQRNQLLRQGLYYGFAIMVIIINLFYFFTLKDETFLYYALFLTSISAALIYRDGLAVTLTSNSWMVQEGEIIFHLIIPLCGAIFAGTYLQHNIYLPKIKYATIGMMVTVIVCYITFLSTRNVFWYALGDIVAINVLTLYWLTGVYLFKKNDFAKFFTIAYFLILILAFDFFICPLLGLPNIGVTTDLLKVGGVFEMLTLSYAVVYRMKFLQKENDKIRNDLYAYTQEIQKLTEDLEDNKSGDTNTAIQKLTPRQAKILNLLTDGMTNKEIAEEMSISINTVKYHIKIIYDTLEVSSRKEIMSLNYL